MTDSWTAAGGGDLGLPAPPATLAGAIRALAPQRWGSLAGTRPLRALGELAADFEHRRNTAAEDYVLAGVQSIATNIEAVHYHVVVGQVGLFVQARSGAKGRPTLELAARVQELAVGLDDAGELGPPGQLVVLHSDFGTCWWKWTGETPAGANRGLPGALRWLEGRTGTGEPVFGFG
jgi:hypothetical protein